MREGGREAKQAAYVDIEGKMYSLTTDLTRVESRDIVADIIVEQSDLAFLHSSYARVVMSCDHTRPVMVAMLRGIYCTLFPSFHGGSREQGEKKAVMFSNYALVTVRLVDVSFVSQPIAIHPSIRFVLLTTDAMGRDRARQSVLNVNRVTFDVRFRHPSSSSGGKKNKFGHFLVVVQLIHRLTQADCTTATHLFFFPLLDIRSASRCST